MAKYHIDHSCGHTETHQLYGKHTGREIEEKRLATKQCTACAELAKVAYRAKQAASETAASNDLQLPALIGSDKQIAWAQSIRLKIVTETATLLKQLAGTELGYQAFERLKLRVDAKFWIDNRYESPEKFLALA